MVAMHVRDGGSWKPVVGIFGVRPGLLGTPQARAAYVFHSGSWVQVPYTPVAVPPTGLSVISPTNNYSSIQLTWGLEGSGVGISGVRVRKYAENGTTLLEEHILPPYALSYTFSVTQDTKYIFRVSTYNTTGTYSSEAELRYWVGHPQVLTTVTDYGWGSTWNINCTQGQGFGLDFVSSAQSPAQLAIDDSTNTYWLSSAVSSPDNGHTSGANALQGLRITFPDSLRANGGNRVLYAVVWFPEPSGSAGQDLMYNFWTPDGYVKGDAYAPNPYAAGSNWASYFNHPQAGSNLARDVAGSGPHNHILTCASEIHINTDPSDPYGNVSKMLICCGNTFPVYGGGDVAAAIGTVTLYMQRWEAIGSHQVVTTSEQRNTTW